ncbi:MAG TPA: response regulator [Hanamia sp.]|jgi:two-component system, OmpR family, response regulator|nr:response regulator [Hanamia sp.]
MIKVKILIIDDEEDFCMIMKSYFERKGMEVFLAFNLTDGLNFIKHKNPDILFLDNNLPDGEGWSKTVDILNGNPSLKINLISAYKEKTNEYDAFSNVSVWEKPVSIRKLEKAFAQK